MGAEVSPTAQRPTDPRGASGGGDGYLPVAPKSWPPPQGCLTPVRVVIPKGSILDPSPEAAVVGGNVLTSQRVVDVILGAFGACAASQVQQAGGPSPLGLAGGLGHGLGRTGSRCRPSPAATA